MPDAVPNYLTTASDGTVSADFPGGVTVLEDPNQAANVNSMAKGHGVTWYRGKGGAIVAQIAANATGTIPDSSQLRVQSRSPNQSGFAGMAMQGFDSGSGSINTLLPFNSELLLDSSGSSHWLQLIGNQNRRMQLTQQGFAATAGWNTYSFSWPTPFATFQGFTFSILVSAGATITGQETFGGNTSGFSVNVSSVVAQNCAVFALGFGT